MSDILNPIREVRVGDETIQVRELVWREGLEFLQRIAAAVSTVLEQDGTLTPTPDAIAKIVSRSSELTSYLLVHATGKDQAWLDAQRVTVVIELLDAALELNLSEDLVERGKRLADRVRVTFGMDTTPGSSPA